MPAVVNVLGLRHSGTTMLHLMLARGDDAIACGEISGWFRVARHRRAAIPPDLFAPLAHVKPSEFHAMALDHFGADFIIDSSKSIGWVLDVNHWAVERGIQVYNILVWKSPVRQAYSNWKRGQSWRRRYLKYHKRLLRSGLDIVSVRYDQLVCYPSETLEAICRCIGMRYFAGKENFWEEAEQFAGSNAGVRRQVRRGTSRFELEQFSPGFIENARDIEAKSQADGRLASVLRDLSAHDVAGLHANQRRLHGYRVTVSHFVERYFVKWPRGYLLRLRWNVFQPARQRFVHSKRRRNNKSYDPESGAEHDRI